MHGQRERAPLRVQVRKSVAAVGVGANRVTIAGGVRRVHRRQACDERAAAAAARAARLQPRSRVASCPLCPHPTTNPEKRMQAAGRIAWHARRAGCARLPLLPPHTRRQLLDCPAAHVTTHIPCLSASRTLQGPQQAPSSRQPTHPCQRRPAKLRHSRLAPPLPSRKEHHAEPGQQAVGGAG